MDLNECGLCRGMKNETFFCAYLTAVVTLSTILQDQMFFDYHLAGAEQNKSNKHFMILNVSN